MGGDALLADGVGLLHVGAVLAHTADVHCIGHADDRLDLAGEARHLVGGAHDLAALGAAGRGNDDVVALFDLEIAGIKIIGAAVFLEFYRNYFHGKFLCLFVRQKCRWYMVLPGSLSGKYRHRQAQIAVACYGFSRCSADL